MIEVINKSSVYYYEVDYGFEEVSRRCMAYISDLDLIITLNEQFGRR
jgi:hypothetical protein